MDTKILNNDAVKSTSELTISSEQVTADKDDHGQDACRNGVCSVNWKPSRVASI